MQLRELAVELSHVSSFVAFGALSRDHRLMSQGMLSLASRPAKTITVAALAGAAFALAYKATSRYLGGADEEDGNLDEARSARAGGARAPAGRQGRRRERRPAAGHRLEGGGQARRRI